MGVPPKVRPLVLSGRKRDIHEPSAIRLFLQAHLAPSGIGPGVALMQSEKRSDGLRIRPDGPLSITIYCDSKILETPKTQANSRE